MIAPLTEIPPAGAVVIFDFDRYHACRFAMTKKRPAVVLGVRGTRALIVPLSQSAPYNADEPYVKLGFRLREHLNSYAKIMMLESVPLADLEKPYSKTLGCYTVPQISNEDLDALRRALAAVTFVHVAA